MKNLIFVVFSLLLFSCNAQKGNDTQEPQVQAKSKIKAKDIEAKYVLTVGECVFDVLSYHTNNDWVMLVVAGQKPYRMEIHKGWIHLTDKTGKLINF